MFAQHNRACHQGHCLGSSTRAMPSFNLGCEAPRHRKASCPSRFGGEILKSGACKQFWCRRTAWATPSRFGKNLQKGFPWISMDFLQKARISYSQPRQITRLQPSGMAVQQSLHCMVSALANLQPHSTAQRSGAGSDVYG